MAVLIIAADFNVNRLRTVSLIFGLLGSEQVRGNRFIRLADNSTVFKDS